MCTDRIAISQAVAKIGLFFAVCTAVLLVFSVTPVIAGDVALEWDPNMEPSLAGYRLY